VIFAGAFRAGASPKFDHCIVDLLEQGVAPVTHAHTATQLVALGQDTEGRALSRAVRAWAEDRIQLIGIKTIVCT